MDLKNRSVLITGGVDGLGRGIAEEFADAGANICVLDVNEDGIEEINANSRDSIVGVAGDVRNYADNRRAVETCVDRFGGLDTFIGNAGIFDNFVSLDEVPADEFEPAFDELFSINVLGYLLGAKAALPELRRDGDGTMVFTASFASFNPGGGGIIYTPAKHAVLGIIRQLGRELAPEVRVNGVAQGYVPTGLGGLSSLEQSQEHAADENMEEVHPLKTVPEPEEYAGYYAFLATDMSKGTTGDVIMADCGLSMTGI
jgi:NAD(P)-dependent dehydrogenase (short-subunit alcohol dehydrogenase family)